MRKINLFLVCVMILWGTSLCYAADFILNTELQESINISDFCNLETDWKTSIHLKWPTYNLTLGKDQLVWGVGKTGTLSISPTSPSIPLVQYQITLPLINYTNFMSPLERETNRWLFGHRLEGKLSSFQIGIWEMMLCSDEIFPGYYIPIPLFPLYAKQHISYKLFDRTYDTNSNAMLGIDFKYKMPGIGEVYGELVIDDFPQKREYHNPKKAGGLLGFSYNFSKHVEVWTEYVRINNFVYTHRNPTNRYLYHGQSFGHWLGMDGDLFAIGLNQDINKNNRVYWQINSIRKGEGTYEDNWNIEFEDNNEFLTGIIEKSLELQVKLEHNFSPSFQTDVSTVIGRSQNANHQENLTENYFKLNASLIYSFEL